MNAELLAFLTSCDVWAGTLDALHLLCASVQAECTMESVLGRVRPVERIGNVAVVPFHGVVNYRRAFGADVLVLQSNVQAALDDSQVQSIVLDVDSPGGGVTGLPETSEFLRRAREVKPIHAFAHPLMASAAYWIASQATTVSAMPSAMVGSIGVRTTHIDFSGMDKRMGVKFTTIASREHKLEFDPDMPLSESAKARATALVKEIDAQFISDIAKGRKQEASQIDANCGQGRLLTATEAREHGLIDATRTFSDMLSRVATPAVLNAQPQTVRELEAGLREVFGYSARAAKRIASEGFGKGPEDVEPIQDKPAITNDAVRDESRQQLMNSIRSLTEVFK